MRQQLAGVDLQCNREADEVDRGDVATPLLDASDVVAVEARSLGELFLREPERQAALPDPVA